jgi:hypothetical protein
MTFIQSLFDREAPLIWGAILAGVSAYITLKGAGGLDDGFQLDPDGIFIAGPILAALGIRYKTWSQDSVDVLVPRANQEAYKADKRRK